MLKLINKIKSNTNTWSILTIGLIILALSVPVFAQIYFGSYSRYIADDYCSAGAYRSLGFVQSQIQRYLTWDGRFSFTFFIMLFARLGNQSASIIPGITIVLWLGSLYLFFSEILKKYFNNTKWWISIILSMSVLFIVFYSLPALPEDLYWLTGNTTYLFPIIGETFLAWIITRNFHKIMGLSTIQKIPIFVISFICSFVLSGFSEVSTAIHVAIWGLFFLIVCVDTVRRVKSAWFPFFAGMIFIGAFCGFLVMFTAPGNVNRMGPMDFSIHPGIFETIINATKMSIKFIVEWAHQNAGILWTTILIVMLMALLTPSTLMILVQKQKQQLFKHSIFFVTLAIILTVVSFIPGYWVSLIAPPDRVLILPVAIFTLALLMFSFSVGHLVRSEIIKTDRLSPKVNISLCLLSIVFIVTVPVLTTTQYATQVFPVQKEYSEKWDIQNADIVSQKDSGSINITTVTAAYYLANLERITGDATYWTNQCAAEYYGVESIIGQ